MLTSDADLSDYRTQNGKPTVGQTARGATCLGVCSLGGQSATQGTGRLVRATLSAIDGMSPTDAISLQIA